MIFGFIEAERAIVAPLVRSQRRVPASRSAGCVVSSGSARVASSPGRNGLLAVGSSRTWTIWRIFGRPSRYPTRPMAVRACTATSSMGAMRSDGIARRVMRENQLIARQKRRFKRTTDSEHAWPVAPNLVAQDFAADGPDRKWGADISYIWAAEGRLYLAVVLDLFSRRVLGWATSDRLKRPRRRSPAPCFGGSQPRAGAGPSFGPRVAILRGRLSGPAPQTRYPDLDERGRELLRQLNGGNVLHDHDLADSLAIAPAGRKRRRQIHRRVL